MPGAVGRVCRRISDTHAYQVLPANRPCAILVALIEPLQPQHTLKKTSRVFFATRIAQDQCADGPSYVDLSAFSPVMHSACEMPHSSGCRGCAMCDYLITRSKEEWMRCE